VRHTETPYHDTNAHVIIYHQDENPRLKWGMICICYGLSPIIPPYDINVGRLEYPFRMVGHICSPTSDLTAEPTLVGEEYILVRGCTPISATFLDIREGLNSGRRGGAGVGRGQTCVSV
jgi:hypothetical protein